MRVLRRVLISAFLMTFLTVFFVGVIYAETEKFTPYAADPRKTALIIIDMQYGFLEHGAILECKYPGWEVLVPNHKKLISFFREHNMPIIWVAFYVTPDTQNLMRKFWSKINPPKDFFYPGNHETQIIAEIGPEPGERVVWKHGFDAFYGTDLDVILRTLGIEYTVFTGVATNYCVTSSLRGAFHHQYQPYIISDAAASLSKEFHEMELQILGIGFATVRTTDEFISELSKGPFPTTPVPKVIPSAPTDQTFRRLEKIIEKLEKRIK